MTEKIPGQLGVDYTCKNCMFSIYIQPDPKVLQRVHVCKRMPPTVQLMPVNGGVQAIPVACTVTPDEWCFQYHPKPDAANEPKLKLV